MTREEAIDLVRQYQTLCRAVGVKDPTLRDIADRWPSDGSERKAMRWLGFMQGALYATRLLSLGEIKVHSKDRHVPMPSDPVQTTDCGSVANVLRAAHDVYDRLCYLRGKCRDSNAVVLEANELAIKVSDEIIRPLEETEQESVYGAAGAHVGVQARNVHSTWLSDGEREIRMSVSVDDAMRMIKARGRDGVLEVRFATATDDDSDAEGGDGA